MSKFIGRVIGNLMTEKALAITFFAGHPEVALIWAVIKSIKI